jgi:hypothetical protein
MAEQVPSIGRDYYKNQGPEPLTLWRTSVHQDADATPGTWHWPEYVPAKS